MQLTASVINPLMPKLFWSAIKGGVPFLETLVMNGFMGSAD